MRTLISNLQASVFESNYRERQGCARLYIYLHKLSND